MSCILTSNTDSSLADGKRPSTLISLLLDPACNAWVQALNATLAAVQVCFLAWIALKQEAVKRDLERHRTTMEEDLD